MALLLTHLPPTHSSYTYADTLTHINTYVYTSALTVNQANQNFRVSHFLPRLPMRTKHPLQFALLTIGPCNEDINVEAVEELSVVNFLLPALSKLSVILYRLIICYFSSNEYAHSYFVPMSHAEKLRDFGSFKG